MKQPALLTESDGARIFVGSDDSPNGLWLLNLLGEFTGTTRTLTVPAWNSTPNPESPATVEASRVSGGDFNDTFRCAMMEARQHQFATVVESDGSALEDMLAGSLPQWANSLARSAVVEERNRLAREIHDTVAQEFS